VHEVWWLIKRLSTFEHYTVRLMPGIIQGKKGPKWYYSQQAPFCTMKMGPVLIMLSLVDVILSSLS